jgi:hypothetical protein
MVALEVRIPKFRPIRTSCGLSGFAAFFDDLHGHYDAFEWRDPLDRKERTVRVYDLRTRVEGRPAKVV